MTNNPVIDEVSRWSDLPGLIERYIGSLGDDGVGRVFGYASVIGKHKDIKPESRIPNEENVSVDGMQAAMNVYAIGHAEFRGTTDLDSGVYNIGLYAGLEVSEEEGAQAFGINVTLERDQLIEGLKAFADRELGKVPEGFTLDDFFNPSKKEKVAALKGDPEDDFGLYKFQILNTRTEKGMVPAIAVSTNEKSECSAIGISPHQAAYHILDGMGYARPSSNGETMLGGEALDYFLNLVIKPYEELGYKQPKIEATRDAVLELAQTFKDIHLIQSCEHLPDKDKAARIEWVIKRDFVEKGVNISTPLFLNGECFAKRDPVDEEYKAESDLPKTAEDKFKRFTDIVDSGRLAPLQR